MDERIREFIRSDDPQDRIKAVKALAREDPEDKQVLALLAQVYRDDPDEDVRAWAKKAGVHLKKQLFMEEWQNDGTPEQEYVDVSEENQREARRLINQATQDDLIGEAEKAEKAVRRAFKLNPNLQHEADPVRVAARVLGMREADVLDELLD